MFATKEDFARAMLEGREFKTHASNKIWWDGGFWYEDSQGERRALQNWYIHPSIAEISPKKKWTTDLPRWCMVRDNVKHDWGVEQIVTYTADDSCPYGTGLSNWKIAKPLPKELCNQLDKEKVIEISPLNPHSNP